MITVTSWFKAWRGGTGKKESLDTLDAVLIFEANLASITISFFPNENHPLQIEIQYTQVQYTDWNGRPANLLKCGEISTLHYSIYRACQGLVAIYVGTHL